MSQPNITPKKRGRPREFDRARALERALRLFWRHGYEGVSTEQLTRAMRITPPSLYAAFGSKEKLFREAVELYVTQYASFISRVIEESTSAKEGFSRLLLEAAKFYAGGDNPPGCLVANGLLACSRRHRDAAKVVSERRVFSLKVLKSRLDRAVKAGEIPANTDTRALAAFFGAVMQGMSVQAADGASVANLEGIARASMGAWPRASS